MFLRHAIEWRESIFAPQLVQCAQKRPAKAFEESVSGPVAQTPDPIRAISHGLDRAFAQLGRIHFLRKLWPAAFAHIERVEARKWTRAIRSHVAGTFQTRTDRTATEGIRVPAPINPGECSFHRALA